MENKGVLTKILTVAGTVLVWFPILAPIFFTTIRFIQSHRVRFDYLMPAELGLFAFGGGILLLVGAIRARAYGKMIGWGLAIALLMIVGGQALAVVTGLADGSTDPDGWEWALVLGALILYGVAVIEVGVGGILLSRDVFKSQPKPVAP